MKTKFQCRLTSALTTLSAAAGTNVKTLRVGMIATTLLTLSAITSPARADYQYGDRDGWRQDNREIRQDRRELRGDYRELAGDRADYRRAMARGDVARMHRERMEIRQDKREIYRDRAELRRDVRDARHDRHHVYAGWQVPLSIHWYAGGGW